MKSKKEEVNDLSTKSKRFLSDRSKRKRFIIIVSIIFVILLSSAFILPRILPQKDPDAYRPKDKSERYIHKTLEEICSSSVVLLITVDDVIVNGEVEYRDDLAKGAVYSKVTINDVYNSRLYDTKKVIVAELNKGEQYYIYVFLGEYLRNNQVLYPFSFNSIFLIEDDDTVINTNKYGDGFDEEYDHDELKEDMYVYSKGYEGQIVDLLNIKDKNKDIGNDGVSIFTGSVIEDIPLNERTDYLVNSGVIEQIKKIQVDEHIISSPYKKQGDGTEKVIYLTEEFPSLSKDKKYVFITYEYYDHCVLPYRLYTICELQDDGDSLDLVLPTESYLFNDEASYEAPFNSLSELKEKIR